MPGEVLVGDVGGTNVRFGLARRDGGGAIRISDFSKVRGDAFDGFEAALAAYLEQSGVAPAGRHCVFALAGPPQDGTVQLTNRDWFISAASLCERFGFARVLLVNDFAGMARAVPELPEGAFLPVKPGEPMSDAPIVVAGPGTGFGVATLLPQGDDHWRIVSGEGGFMAYAPQTDLEYELARRLRDESGYVYNELVCAGIGLEPVHRALCEIYGRACEAMEPGEMIARAGRGDEMFLELCRIRARGTLRAAGDLVLANGARGGVVVAGGVSERLIDFLRDADAIERFLDRGRHRAYMQPVPIRLMRDPEAPLIGAAAIGFRSD